MSVLGALNKPISFKIARPDRVRKVVVEVGGVPRADLLPPSVVAARRLRAAVRATVMGCATVALVVAGAVGFSGYQAFQSAAALDAATARTTELLATQTAFSDVATAMGSIDTLERARAGVGATDVLWAPYLDEVDGLLPAGAFVSAVSIEANTVDVAPLGALEPGAGADDRVATLLYTVRTADISAIQRWILRLPELTGYRSASLRSVTEEDGGYSAQVQLVVGPEVYSGRFGLADAAADTTAATGATEGDSE